MKIYNNRIKFLSLLLTAIALSSFSAVLADTECIGRDCSIGVSLDVQKTVAFNGTVKDVTGSLILNANVSVLSTGYSTLTPTGIYNITQDLSGLYSLIASAGGYLSQTKSNQLAEFGKTKQVDFNLGQLGRIKGNVLDFFTSTGINNANLSLFLYDEFLDSTLTNSTGYYEFNGLAPGYYDINVEATGYTLNSKPDNHVLEGQNTTVDFWLW